MQRKERLTAEEREILFDAVGETAAREDETDLLSSLRELQRGMMELRTEFAAVAEPEADVAPEPRGGFS